ncbi:MAG: DUF4411 family protein [Candidatus Aminicenantes bacterium]|nr:DUF4411 family protein [Candidatus Aminicenantes bacterium]
MRYSIDTSALLDGWTRYYPPDVFPDVWTGIEELIEQGEIRATEEVFVELEKRDDQVFAWAKDRKASLFVPIGDAIQEKVAAILAQHERLVRHNRSGADPFVIGLAMVEGCTVVTGERLSGSLAKPRIPDVCTALEVPYLDLLGLFRQQNWRFVR